MSVRNFGMVALLLVRMDARMGLWQGVDDMAQHFNVSAGFVRQTLEQLLADELVRVQRDASSGEISHAMVPAP